MLTLLLFVIGEDETKRDEPTLIASVTGDSIGTFETDSLVLGEEKTNDRTGEEESEGDVTNELFGGGDV